MLFYVCFVIYVHKCATCVMCVECIYIVGQEYSSVCVFWGVVEKKEITRISRCVWGVWLFQVFNLKTITVNPIVYGYRIIKREIFTCSAP